MVTRFPAIQDLTITRIRNVVRRALRDGLDAEMLNEFLACVDWGTAAAADPRVSEILGQLEAWAIEDAEGFLSRAEYAEKLRAFAETPGPRKEPFIQPSSSRRQRHLVGPTRS